MFNLMSIIEGPKKKEEKKDKFNLSDFDIEKFNPGDTIDELKKTIETLKKTKAENYDQGLVFYAIVEAIHEKMDDVEKQNPELYRTMWGNDIGKIWELYPQAANDTIKGVDYN